MEDFIQEFKQMKETLTNLRNFNEERLNEFSEYLEEICELKESHLKQSDEIDKLQCEIAKLKGENVTLHEQIKTLRSRESMADETSSEKTLSLSSANKPALFDKKLNRNCLKVSEMEKAVWNLQDQVRDLKEELDMRKGFSPNQYQRQPQTGWSQSTISTAWKKMDLPSKTSASVRMVMDRFKDLGELRTSTLNYFSGWNPFGPKD